MTDVLFPIPFPADPVLDTMDNPSSSLILPLYTLISICEKALFFNKKPLDKMRRYTMHELLDELDVIECFQAPGKAPIQGEVLKKQEQIYRDLGVTPLLASPENQ